MPDRAGGVQPEPGIGCPVRPTEPDLTRASTARAGEGRVRSNPSVVPEIDESGLIVPAAYARWRRRRALASAGSG
jgi:hypothetical protein